MITMIENFFPLERIKVRKCDKPWMTPSIKSAIGRRQKALHQNGKNSDIYKYWRNRVQSSIKVARKIYYMRSKERSESHWWSFVEKFLVF